MLSLVGVVSGVMGMFNCSDNVVAVVAFVVLEVMSIGIYCVIEGRVDAASVKSGILIAQQVADMFDQLKKNENVTCPSERESDKYLDAIDPK